MRKKLFAFIMIAILTIPVMAQENGDLKKQFYFRFGWSSPSWKTYGAEGKDDFPSDVRRFGGVFEMGAIFIINRWKIADGLRIGINVDYLSLSAHAFDISDNLNTYNGFIGSKVGPSLSYSPVKSLTFDVFAKINPIWLGGVVGDDGDVDENEDVYIGYLGMKYSLGVNIRWTILVFGFEYNPGSLKLKNDKGMGEYLGDIFNYPDEPGEKTSLTALNFTLGFSF
jgi:hypothetical protein